MYSFLIMARLSPVHFFFFNFCFGIIAPHIFNGEALISCTFLSLQYKKGSLHFQKEKATLVMKSVAR